jgi:hypothetical protein
MHRSTDVKYDYCQKGAKVHITIVPFQVWALMCQIINII